MNIVFILGSYYPKYSAVGKCMGNLADCMAQKHNVTVIAEQNIYGQQQQEVFNGQRIIRVSTKEIRSDLKNDFLYSEKKRSGFSYKLIHQWNRVWRNVRKLVSRTTVDNKMIRAYLYALEAIETPIDVIIPTCMPFTSVVAALKYKETHSEIQIIPYLYDLFADNRNLNINSINLKCKRLANLKLEQLMLQESKCIFYVDNWTKHIDEVFPQYKAKSIRVEHPLLLDKRVDKSEILDTLIHVVYTGVVDSKARNPQKTLKVILQSGCSGMSFDFYGYGDVSAQDILETASKESALINYFGRVDTETAEKKRSTADVLLSIGNSDYNQTPSKLIEYIATGKPIIHFAQSLEDPAIKILARYPTKLIIDLNSENPSNEISDFIKNNYRKRVPFSEIKALFMDADPIIISKKIIDEISKSSIGRVGGGGTT